MNTKAQESYELEWVKTLDISGGIYGNFLSSFKVGMTNDDCFYIVTRSAELFIIDLDGNVVSNKSYYTLGASEYPFCGDLTQDGGFILAGYNRDSYDSESDTYLLKLDSEGTKEWDTIIDIGGQDSAVDIIAYGDYYYVLEYYLEKIVLLKIDLSGNLVKKTNITEDGYIYNSFQKTSDGDFIILCSNSQTPEPNIRFVKFDKEGLIDWERTIQEGKYIYFGQISHSVDELDEKGYGLFVNYWTNDDGVYSAVIKTDDKGNKIFLENFEYGYSIIQGIGTKDNGFIGTGRIAPDLNDIDNSNVLVVKTDSRGNEEWNLTFGWNYRDMGYYIIEPNTGDYYVFGTTNHTGKTVQDMSGNMFIAKISTSANSQNPDNQTDQESSDESDKTNEKTSDKSSNNSNENGSPGFELILSVITIIGIIIFMKRKH